MLLIVEDELARPEDPFLEDITTDWVSYREDVLHLREVKGRFGLTDAEFLNSSSSGYPLNAFVIFPWPGPKPMGPLTDEDINGLVGMVRIIIVGAYDAEATLLWVPGGLDPFAADT
jgi:hypothetical protein